MTRVVFLSSSGPPSYSRFVLLPKGTAWGAIVGLLSEGTTPPMGPATRLWRPAALALVAAAQAKTNSVNAASTATAILWRDLLCLTIGAPLVAGRGWHRSQVPLPTIGDHIPMGWTKVNGIRPRVTSFLRTLRTWMRSQRRMQPC